MARPHASLQKKYFVLSRDTQGDIWTTAPAISDKLIKRLTKMPSLPSNKNKRATGRYKKAQLDAWAFVLLYNPAFTNCEGEYQD
jgi:hypothetical protein